MRVTRLDEQNLFAKDPWEELYISHYTLICSKCSAIIKMIVKEPSKDVHLATIYNYIFATNTVQCTKRVKNGLLHTSGILSAVMGACYGHT